MSDFVEQCKANLASADDADRRKLERYVRDKLQIKLALDQSPVFPCILSFNTRSKETKRSVLLHAPVKLQTGIHLPPEARLEYCMSLLPYDDERFQGGRLTVRILDQSGKVLLENDKSLYGLQPETWHHESLDLSELPARDIILGFELKENPSKSPCIVLGEPVIRSFRKNVDDRPPNIIIICLDTLRADHLGCMGYDRETSPTLDRMASEGTLFTQAFSQAGYTLPSHKSFLSGFYPQLFFYYSNPGKKLTNQIPLIQEYLREAGYYCVAYTGGVYVGAQFGFHNGFDLFNQIVEQASVQKRVGDEDRTVKDSGFDNAINWLQENGTTGPFFMFFHTYGTHVPYAPPSGFDKLFQSGGETDLGATIPTLLLEDYNLGKIPSESIDEGDVGHIKDVYDRGIRWIDGEVGRFYGVLDSLGIMDNTILIVLSDHGEEFREHGRFLHHRMYEQDLHVPLILRFPRVVPAGKKIETRVELVDLVPTILEILGIRPESPPHGRSLVPLMRGSGGNPKVPLARPIFGSQEEWKTVRVGNLKYHLRIDEQVREELFNLREDPLEQHNLLADSNSESDALNDLRTRMLYYMAENQGGWNLLIIPRAEQRYTVEVSGLETDKQLIAKGRKYSIEGRGIIVHVNKLKTRVAGRPALLTFDGEFDESFSISISKQPRKEDGPPTAVGVLMGLSGGRVQLSPLLISANTRLGGGFPIADGLPAEILERYEAILWQTALKLRKPDERVTSEISEETLRELRDLGYLH